MAARSLAPITDRDPARLHHPISAQSGLLTADYLEDITLKEAWTGPAALGLFPHALADVAKLPVREVICALHFKADLTLGLGTVAFDYMKK
jgi:acetoacetate decarboxylase